MQNHKRQLTSTEIAEREALLAHGLPDDYNEEVEEMNGEEDPRSRHQLRAAEAEARLEAGRQKKAAAKRNKARRKKAKAKKGGRK